LAFKTLVAYKGIGPVLLKVSDYCSFADYFIICSGGSRRHVLALAEHVEAALARIGLKPFGVEGLEEGQWVLLDYNTLVIHIFMQPLREFYNLEDLWSEAPKIQVDTENSGLASPLSSQEPLPDADTQFESTHHE
jgi:ribosome-associated protein